jgi:hypothetical protein
MKLEAPSGASFELAVQGYQCLDVTEDPWNSNWLVVIGTIRDAERPWLFVEPCLTTFELVELADWLETLRQGGETPDVCSFMEPNLRFSYSNVPEPAIQVRFAQDSAPSWLTDPEARRAGVTLSFPVSSNDLIVAAGGLRSILREYPIRGGAA